MEDFLRVKLIILQEMIFFFKYRLLLENEHLNSIFIREKWVGHQVRYDFIKLSLCQSDRFKNIDESTFFLYLRNFQATFKFFFQIKKNLQLSFPNFYSKETSLPTHISSILPYVHLKPDCILELKAWELKYLEGIAWYVVYRVVPPKKYLL